MPGLAGTQTSGSQYDQASNRSRLTWPDGYYVNYSYDALNHLTSASENGTTTLASYSYDTMTRRSGIAYGNGASVALSWSAENDLLTLGHAFTTPTNNVTFTNTYSPSHQIVSASISNSAFEYAPPATGTDNYGGVNALNQYPTVTPSGSGSNTLTYDASGNLTFDGSFTYAYDPENRLMSANKTGASASYIYDPLGRRAAKTVNSTSTFFLDSGDDEIAEYDGTGSLTRRFVPGSGTNDIVASVTAAGAHSYFHTDKIGSLVATSNVSGGLIEGPYTYDPYGNGGSVSGTPFQYGGAYLDSETGHYYERARYYSNALGRFLQTDPVGYKDDFNLYTYVRNDPTDRNDPLGLYDVTPCGDDKACGTTQTQFETQRQANLNSGDSDLAKAAQAWGSPGDRNGITVTFKSQSDMDKESGRKNTDANIPAGQMGLNGAKMHANISVSENLGDREMRRMNAHEGSHFEDAESFAKSFDPKSGKYSAQQNYSSRQTETKAYELGNAVKPYGYSSPQELQKAITKNYPGADMLLWPSDVTQ